MNLEILIEEVLELDLDQRCCSSNGCLNSGLLELEPRDTSSGHLGDVVQAIVLSRHGGRGWRPKPGFSLRFSGERTHPKFLTLLLYSVQCRHSIEQLSVATSCLLVCRINLAHTADFPQSQRNVEVAVLSDKRNLSDKISTLCHIPRKYQHHNNGRFKAVSKNKLLNMGL
jgi:hypothetical protein